MPESKLPNLKGEIKKSELSELSNPKNETFDVEASNNEGFNTTFELKKIEKKDQAIRKLKRLKTLQYILLGIGIGLAISLCLTAYISIYIGTKTPTELIVFNTILGSSLTTIIGVLAGTSID